MTEIFKEYFEQNNDTETGSSYADYMVYTDYTDVMQFVYELLFELKKGVL